MTGYLDPLNKLFPVPLDGGIPSFWQLAAEWKHRPARRCGDSPSLWDEQTRVAARWANGPRPAGGEAMWTTYVEPVKPLPSHTWPQPAVAGPPPPRSPTTIPCRRCHPASGTMRTPTRG